MLVPLSWLKEFVDIIESADKLAELLTASGIEVASIVNNGGNLKNIFYGYVKEVCIHSEKLNKCLVDCGERGIFTCVTTDKTIIAGDYIAYAVPGAVIANGMQVSKRMIKDIESEGMMLSVVELGLAQSAASIWRINDPKLAKGADLIKALNLDDSILEIEITPNRSDCLSILGLAYNIAAITGRKVKNKIPSLKTDAELKTVDKIKISIKNYDACSKYTGRYIENIKIQPASAQMQARLFQCGQRAINNVVDITNYVLLEFGQPLHSFDYDLIEGKEIIVRFARPTETIKTLDGESRQLNENVLIIADAEKPTAVAGVMGGGISEVSEKTKTVLLESAYFNPVNVRKSSRLLNFSSESSYRFERGVDYSRVCSASDRAVELLALNCLDIRISDRLYEVADNIPTHRIVNLRYKSIKRILGIDIEKTTVKKIIENLEFEIIEEKTDALTIKIPFRRVDIEREIDIIEEIAVINGFDKIPVCAPAEPLTLGTLTPKQLFFNRLINFFADKGIFEAINYSFTDPDLNRDFTVNYSEDKVVKINNPLGREISVMRNSVIASLIKTVQNNYKYRNTGNNFFELGKRYKNNAANNGLPTETNIISCVMTEILQPQKYDDRYNIDFFYVKGIIDNLFLLFNIDNIEFSAVEISFLQPGQTALITAAGKELGLFGKLHPDFAAKYDIPDKLYIFEINADSLFELSNKIPEYKEFSRYPFTVRDMSLLIPKSLNYSKIASVVNSMNINILESFELASIYEDESIGINNRGLLVKFKYRAAEKTLTDAEIEAAHKAIFDRLINSLNIKAR